MPDGALVVRTKAKSVAASPALQATVTNAGPSTVYYKDEADVSEESNDGSLTAGTSRTFVDGPCWFISSSVGTKLFVSYSPDATTDMATQAEIDGAFTVSLAGTLEEQGNGPYWMEVVGGVLFVAVTLDAKIKAYDVADLAENEEPILLGEVTVGESTAGLKVRGNFLYVTDQNELKIRKVEVTDPADMEVKATLAYSSGGGGGGRFAINPLGYAFIGGPETGANEDTAVLVNTATMEIEDSLKIGGGLHRGVAALNPRYFALSDRDAHKVYFVDASKPGEISTAAEATLTTSGTITTPLNATENYLLVGDYGSPGYLHVYDTSPLPDAPVLVSTTTIGEGCETIVSRGRRAFIALRATSKMVVVDWRNPATCSVSSIAGSGTVTPGVAVSGARAFLSNAGDTTNGKIDSFRLANNLAGRIATVEAMLAENLDLFEKGFE